jgi:hypothetical protein
MTHGHNDNNTVTDNKKAKTQLILIYFSASKNLAFVLL